MLKKFFRKVRETAKKIAPIAAPIAGFALGPLAGAGIGALLGQYGGTKGALQGAMLGGLGGLLKGGNLFGGSGVNTASKSVIDAAQSGNIEVLRNAIKNAPVEQGGIMGILNKYKLPIIGSVITGAFSQDDKDDVKMRPDVEIGSVPPFDVTPTDIIYPAPVDPINVYGFANGGIVGLKEGGTVAEQGGIEAFNRKNGEIAGPGTMTSDDIPAMLSDGEFVTKAVSVLGAGVKYGGAKTKEEARNKGAEFFYKQQKELEPFGKKVV